MTKKFHYGGQAVMEGVMMRGQKEMVTAVRRPDGGVALNTSLIPAFYQGKLRKTPLVRGIIVLVESLVLGMKSLLYSANIALEEEEQNVSSGVIWIILIVSSALAVGLFLIVPLFLTRLLDQYITSSLLFHLVEGFIRLGVFIAYLKAVTLMPDIKRVFAYHGAEHKTINAYEHGAPLEVEAIKNYDKAHVRCGTSFIFVVLIIAIVVFSFVGLTTIWVMMLSRLVLIPLIAAVSYEIIYFGANHTGNGFIRAILKPGLILQALTTREPDDSQLEIAIAALKKVVEDDGAEAVA